MNKTIQTDADQEDAKRLYKIQKEKKRSLCFVAAWQFHFLQCQTVTPVLQIMPSLAPDRRAVLFFAV
jgi:hypothetical protein